MAGKRTLVFDTECFPDYWSLGVLEPATGATKHFEMYEGHPLELDRVRRILQRFRLYSFNGNNYDILMIMLALNGADNATLKACSDAIIKVGLRPWQVADKFKFDLSDAEVIDHVDLIEVAPGKASLKLYGGRMHSTRLQDNPFDVDGPITPEMRAAVRQYCENDLRTTADLLRTLTPQIELREGMSKEYAIDLRSKSDAQIAEAVLAQRVGAIKKVTVKRPEVKASTVFRYRSPEFIRFTSQACKNLLTMIQTAEFVVQDNGSVREPDCFKGTSVTIGGSRYRIGIGGLHSSEKSVSHVTDGTFLLVDRDVASYYPSIILQCGLAPRHMGDAFTAAYRDIVRRRLEAKHLGRKVEADALKITVNGSFGKLGSKYSVLYSPDLLIQVTVTGQLALLMLIEDLESSGIPVVSANTDGLVIKCPVEKAATMEFIVWAWEWATGFETEAAYYDAIYSRDVNNYIALKHGGGAKLKGAYAPAGLHKNPQNEIVNEAVLAYLGKGTPLAETIRGCTDIRKFLSVRTVNGGALQGDLYLGKVIRWYYARGVEGVLRYKVNGYTVPRTEGAKPLMQLPDAFPPDVNYEWYVNEALDVLRDLGVKEQACELV